MTVCILADAADIDRAKQIELEYMSVDDLKKLNKNKVRRASNALEGLSSYMSVHRSSSRSSLRNTTPSWLRTPCACPAAPTSIAIS
jgi:hypothetical protein